MKALLLNGLPNKYKSMLNQIRDKTVEKIYSTFTFFYLDYLHFDKKDGTHDNNKKMEIILSVLFNYLKNFKFLTYQITSNNNLNYFTENDDITNTNTFIVNIIICIEKECFIIENIYFSLINQIIIKLKEQKISMLNINKNYKNEKLSQEENYANEEILFFCQSFNETKKNSFVEYTIGPTAGYLIRRHFYPTDYFTDQSFFMKTKEEENIKNKILIFLKNPKTDQKHLNQQLIEIYSEIQAHSVESKNINKKLFDKNEFVILRQIFSNDQALFYLVIHRESLFIYLMKELKDARLTEDKREIQFCEGFRNANLTHFYGFVQENNKITCLIYEFLVNGTLKSYIKQNKNKVNELFSLDTMIRVFQGMNYLHSNQLIHRDLKSENILLDNNFVPFISDFPTIRRPMSKEENDDNSEFTNDIGSIIYVSPEQYNGDFVSYPTDVYSFGILIYSLYEKNENTFEKKFENKFIFPEMFNASTNTKTLQRLCIINDQKDRIKTQNIQNMLLNEINLFLSKDKDLLNQMNDVNKDQIIQFIYDIYSFEKLKQEEIKMLNQNIIKCRNFLYSKISESHYERTRFSITQLINDFQFLSNDKISYDIINEILYYYCYCSSFPENNIYSKAAYILAELYYDDKYGSRNIPKSIHYLEIAANQNYLDAQVMLGNIFYEGKLVKRDINKALYYCILASNNNNITSQLTLGMIYLEGYLTPRDIDKSIHYFSLASDQNDQSAQLILGKIYFENKFIRRDIQKSIFYYSLAAKQNSIKAQNQLGHFLYEGKYIDRDIDKAIQYFTSAANQNDSDSQFMLGLIYSNGKYISCDIDKSIHYLTLSSNQNNLNAQFILGHLYYDGIHISRDIDKSIYYFSLAANQNCQQAQFMLGRIYYEGKYVSSDIKKSIHFLELAAVNDVRAQFLLGNIFYEGILVLRDIDKAIHYYSLAANQNLPKAQNILGIIYSEGKYVARNIDKALHYYSLAAGQNLLDAQVNLGYLYYKLHDIKKSIEFFTLAANQNDQIAQLELGYFYLEGVFVNRDINQSILYFNLAAKQNNVNALIALGKLYYENKYISRDIDKSVHYLTLAAKENSPIAQLFLGYIFHRGCYIARDIYKSIYYLKLAADQENFDAQYILGQIYYDGKYIARDIKKSIHYLTLAANQNSIDAQNLLGIIYYIGKYIPQDINKSIYFYSLAAKQNDPESQNALGLLFYKEKLILNDINKSIHYFTLAANQNYPIAQYNLGYIYFFDKSIQNIKKAIKYIQYSSQNRNQDAQLLLADLFLEGKFIKQDINEAIRLYKEVSCFNNNHAKNNLGVIFKNCFDQTEKNIGLAKVYFEEAIKNNNDILAAYNYSNILLDKNESNSNSIKLLIESSSQRFTPSMILLCYLLFFKYNSLNIEIIQKELEIHNKKSKALINEISNVWSRIEPFTSNTKLFIEKYHKFREKYFVYIHHDIKTLQKIIDAQKIQIENKTSKDINDLFYEGFEFDI